ncbi:MAG: pyrimidine 5'-nucleotidase [Sphingomonas sp.]|uniref:pyrimidine 5'-nucleotidase n=1 Tax=unclassified Sphingomonas TaxID=196159 RepID=UPI00245552A0|nr:MULTISPECIES: pyrimidine 5'-nucleotidase [unclassified Sphingomonas]MBQ1498267.1 pyrimidine 5'-nucleotidase [Sphingomonas sp.]MDH4742846.1 pyrimidine 5'-nucleotidase [Sphingomonas sp. CBMAI 2297]
MDPALSHIRNWIFDLDNTLYPVSANLFAMIDARIGQYVQDLLGLDAAEAHKVQKGYFHAHGTTLAGLMAEHGTDPHHYLANVHDVDMGVLEVNEVLVAALARLPGRKLVFTNGDAPYATRVLDRLGLGATFEAIHDVHATGYRPKPDPLAYRGLCDAYGLDPAHSLFVEDMARNLKPAKAIGMTTVWIDNGSEQAPDMDRGFIDYTVNDLGAWLHSILETSA